MYLFQIVSSLFALIVSGVLKIMTLVLLRFTQSPTTLPLFQPFKKVVGINDAVRR